MSKLLFWFATVTSKATEIQTLDSEKDDQQRERREFIIKLIFYSLRDVRKKISLRGGFLNLLRSLTELKSERTFCFTAKLHGLSKTEEKQRFPLATEGQNFRHQKLRKEY